MKFIENKHSLTSQRIQTEAEHITKFCRLCFPWGNLGFCLQSLSPHGVRRAYTWVLMWALGSASSWGVPQWNQPACCASVALNISSHPSKLGKISDFPWDGSRNEHYLQSYLEEKTLNKEKWGWGRGELMGQPCAAGEAASPLEDSDQGMIRSHQETCRCSEELDGFFC